MPAVTRSRARLQVQAPSDRAPLWCIAGVALTFLGLHLVRLVSKARGRPACCALPPVLCARGASALLLLAGPIAACGLHWKPCTVSQSVRFAVVGLRLELCKTSSCQFVLSILLQVIPAAPQQASSPTNPRVAPSPATWDMPVPLPPLRANAPSEVILLSVGQASHVGLVQAAVR